MPLLSHVDRIAASRSTYVFAFRHVAKRHQIGTGRAQDFYSLPDTLRANPDFSADLFRIAGAALAQTPELSVNDIVVMVALAMGGEAFAGRHDIDVPEDLIQRFRDALGVAEPAEEPQSHASSPEPADAAAVPAAGAAHDAAGRGPVPIEPRFTRTASTWRPILDQAVRAELPDDPTPAHSADVTRHIERLESERAELERRLRKMERRLHLVSRKVESLQTPPASGPSAPAASAPRPAAVPPRTATDERRSDRIQYPTAEPATAAVADAPVTESAPLESRMGELMDRIRSWSDVLLFVAVLVFAVIIVAVTHANRSHPAKPSPRPAQSTGSGAPAASSSDDWVAPGTTDHAGAAAPSGPRAQAEADITDTLGAWAEAFVNNDPAAEASFYAPTVDRYFLRRNVSRDYVLRDKQSYRARGNRIQHFTVSGLEFQFQSPASAVVTFTKSWSVTGPQQTGYPHSTRSRVWMTRMPEGWRITGEQDLRPAS